LYLAYNLPYFRVLQAQIVGNEMLSPQEINSAMGIVNQPIFTLKPAELETRLRLNFPELVSAQVAVELPNLVSVSLVERSFAGNKEAATHGSRRMAWHFVRAARCRSSSMS
jgi:cell division septal protein FtsQ